MQQDTFYPEDYGCTAGAAAAVNDAAIATAISKASAVGGVVHFKGTGPYSVSQQINQDVSKFSVTGNQTALNISNDYSGDSFWNIFFTSPYTERYKAIRPAISGISLIGVALGQTPLATTAIRIGHETHPGNSLFTVDHVSIQGFATGFGFTHNAWRIKITDSHVLGAQALAVPEGLQNFGENMVVENCMFADYDCRINIGSGEWNFIGCSFNSALLTVDGGCAVYTTNCHFEPHNIAPMIRLTHNAASLSLHNTHVIFDLSYQINNALFFVADNVATYGLIIRSLRMIQTGKYTPQVNSSNCVLVSGNGRVDIDGMLLNNTFQGFALAKSMNLLYNGDAEKNSPVGWQTFAAYGAASFTTDTTVYKNGSRSFKLTTTSSSIYVGQSVPCTPGKWVFAQAWQKLEAAGSATTSIELNFLSAKGDVIGTLGYSPMSTPQDWLCRRSMSGVAPAGTTSVRVYIGLGSGSAASAWYDDIIVNVA